MLIIVFPFSVVTVLSSAITVSAPPETVFGKTESGSFEDMMHRFKTISDDKLGDLKHGYESKRGKARKR